MMEIYEKYHGKWMLFTHLTENNSLAKAFGICDILGTKRFLS